MGHMALLNSQGLRSSYGLALLASRQSKRQLAREITRRLKTNKALGDRRRFIRILKKDSQAEKLWNLLKLRPDLKVEIIGLSPEKFKAALQQIFAGKPIKKFLKRIGAGARKIIIQEKTASRNEAFFVIKTTSAY